MPVDHIHEDLAKILPIYARIDDACAGQTRVKSKKTEYLPMPNALDTSPENVARYDAYIGRAQFTNFTGNTVAQNVGQCFCVDPSINVPDKMEPWLANMDGDGASAIQLSKKALKGLLKKSRAGLLTVYPATDGSLSEDQKQDQNIRPYIKVYASQDITNWRIEERGKETLVTLIVVREKYVIKDDGFKAEYGVRYREMRLDASNEYVWQWWENDGGEWKGKGFTKPTDGFGEPWRVIPFVILGAEANDWEIEKPLMEDIADLNFGHYINSADYEEASFMMGQPTPWANGLSDTWIDEQWKGKLQFGSRAFIPLPVESEIGLLQMEANSTPKEAMEMKEQHIIYLGGKLTQKREVQQTATEASLNESSETSILASCCNNVSAGMKQSLTYCAQYEGIKPAEEGSESDDEINFDLNTKFATARITPEEQTAVLGLYQGKCITFEEMRYNLRDGGVAYLDDEKAKDQLEKQAEEEFNQAQQDLKGQTDEQIRLEREKQNGNTGE